jgi:hypothetical protein
MHTTAPLLLLGVTWRNTMLRTNMLVIRLTQIERDAIDKLAESEILPVSTFARQLLLKEADRRGFLIEIGRVQQDEEPQLD